MARRHCDSKANSQEEEAIMTAIKCQRCEGTNPRCQTCAGEGEVLRLVTGCRYCKKQVWMLPSQLIVECHESRIVTSFDGVDLVYRGFRFVCVDCYDGPSSIDVEFSRENGPKEVPETLQLSEPKP